MTITVLFFASLKEKLQCDRIQVELPEPARLSALLAALSTKGEAWESLFKTPNELVKVAINQTIVKSDEKLSHGDEVAFFPPVTGG